MATTNLFPFSSPRYIVVYKSDDGRLHRDLDQLQPSRLFPPSRYSDAATEAKRLNADPLYMYQRLVARVLAYDLAADHVISFQVAFSVPVR